MADQLTLAHEREDILLSILVARAREGRALPHAREASRLVGLKGGSGGIRVLRRLAKDGRVVIEGSGRAQVVHIPGHGLSLSAASNAAGCSRRPLMDIVGTVARTACLPVADVLGPARTKLYLRPRFAVVLLARAEGWSYEDIRRAIRRDRSTVVHAALRGAEMLETDTLFARLYRRADSALRGLPPPSFAITATAPVPLVRHPVAVDETDPRQVLDLHRRRRSAARLLAAIRREHPERCAA